MAKSPQSVSVHTEKTTSAPTRRQAHRKAAPLSPIDELRREIDLLFDGFGGSDWWQAMSSKLPALPNWTHPVVDITETDTGFELSADLPGLTEKDVEVALGNGQLIIRGEKTEVSEDKSKDYHRRERHYGAFERSFAVPEGVDEDKIDAKLERGVLTILMPKKAEAKKSRRKVTVKAS